MYNLGQYVPAESVVHKLDPRAKIIIVITLSIIVFRADVFILALLNGLLIMVALVARLSLTSIQKSLKPVLPFFALLFSLYLFFTGGTPIPPFPLGHVNITYEGLHKGTLLVWKFILLVLTSSILTMVTSPSEITQGMERLLRLFKLPGISSHDLAVMLSIALRFIPSLLGEIERMREAQLARGACLTDRVKRTRAVASLVIPLALSVFRRADELTSAMEARGYQRGPRTYLLELSMSPADYVAVILVIAALLALYWG